MNVHAIFRRLVFAQVLLGVAAFCIAAANPGLLLIAGALAAFSWYIVEGPSGRPLPQWVLVPGALAALAWLLFDLAEGRGEPDQREGVIVAMGHFTMWLQVLLLYGRKTNREYVEILVLSLMQMVAASVLSVSIVYGFLLAAYCVLTLFTILVFQLKATADQVAQASRPAAGAAPPGEAPEVKPVFGRGHRWHFRLTAVGVGAVAAAVATLVFLVVPRDPAAQAQQQQAQLAATGRTIGYTEIVQLDGSAPQLGNTEVVLHLTIAGDARPLANQAGVLVRGTALDTYDRSQRTWVRGINNTPFDYRATLSPEGRVLAPLADDEPAVEATITLRDPTRRTLFTLFPAAEVASSDITQISFNPLDQQLSSMSLLRNGATYALRAPVQPPPGFFERYWSPDSPIRARDSAPEAQGQPRADRSAFRRAVERAAGEAAEILQGDSEPAGRAPRSAGGRDGGRGVGQPRPAAPLRMRGYATGWRVQPEEVSRLALEVLASAGVSLEPPAGVSLGEHQARVATVLAEHLRSNYQYSLQNPPIDRSQDPVIYFLFHNRTGHCELFAAGLAAMTRSIGISARVVTGFIASEYNNVGGYYVVRQSNAHAWTEVYCDDLGWIALDSTPQAEVVAEHQATRTVLTSLSNVYEHLEFAWLSSIVTYDQRMREELLGGASERIGGFLARQRELVSRVGAWFSGLTGNGIGDLNIVVIVLIVVGLVLGVAILVQILLTRYRRLVALQLTNLSRGQRRGLVRQLRFYLTMLDMLERHGHVRPAWQSPFGFAEQLALRDPLRFDPVVALTEIFYEIRFGHRELDDDRRQRVRAHLRRLEQTLAQRAR